MSRPSMTTPPRWPISRWRATISPPHRGVHGHPGGGGADLAGPDGGGDVLAVQAHAFPAGREVDARLPGQGGQPLPVVEGHAVGAGPGRPGHGTWPRCRGRRSPGGRRGVRPAVDLPAPDGPSMAITRPRGGEGGACAQRAGAMARTASSAASSRSFSSGEPMEMRSAVVNPYGPQRAHDHAVAQEAAVDRGRVALDVHEEEVGQAGQDDQARARAARRPRAPAPTGSARPCAGRGPCPPSAARAAACPSTLLLNGSRTMSTASITSGAATA